MSRTARHRDDGESASNRGIPADRLRDLVSQHLEELGVVGTVAVIPHNLPDAYGLDIELADGLSLLLEATESWPGVRILDPHGEDVTVRQALDYIALRHLGEQPSQALEMVRTPKHRD